MKTAKFWLSILSHVYYMQKMDKALLYNTQTGENIHTKNSQIINLLEQMHEKKNLGVIEIDEISYNEIEDFIKESITKNICTITKKVAGQPKPIQLMPILNLQRDIEKLIKEEGRSLGEGVLHYLSDVTIYLNQTCSLNCPDCNNLCNQFFHCSKSFTEDYIDFDFLKQFLKQLSFTFIRRLAITGGNIFLYPYFSELISFLQEEKIRPLFGVHYGNIDSNKMSELNGFFFEILVTFPLENDFVHNIALLLIQENVKYIFVITSQEDYNQAEILVSEYAITNYEYKPFYTGKNQDFFEENIYLTKDDIFSNILPQRIIFAHQKLNTNFFGKIHLLSNGDIKAHTLKPILGNFKQTPLVKILEKEMITNTAWRIIRDKTPCNECLYQFLCPSPSDYEWVMARNNLCHIVQ